METSIDEIPRHEPSNPYNYTKIQIAKRQMQLKQMEKDFPNVPYGWLELVWDFCENKTEDELNEIIESGAFEGKSAFTLKKAEEEVAVANEKNKVTE